HTITRLTPSLVPLVADDPCCKDMQGLSLKNVTLRLLDTASGKCLYEELGEMLFTHFGVSGPLVLSASSMVRDMQPGRYHLVIDWKPGLSEEQLDARLLRDFEKNANKDFQNSLGALLPATAIPVFVAKSGIPGDKKVHQITKQERQALLDCFKRFTLPVADFRPVEEAIVTSGGVSTKEINPKTMESKLVSGLYFAGELIDVDGYTGGFNLQIAFSTGSLAGHYAGGTNDYV
ncbi:MAG: aminoacetone oxidase family FAD-binding enzyme, partial [Clostridia bacterium]|nr:aminoacetone oxidase family FAD-binding enzyme [Clostridia bacterium]